MTILNNNTEIPKPTLPGANQHLEGDTRIAAFFDLDKTILATASAMALSSPLVHAGVMSRWDSLRATLVQLPYLFTGADDERMRSMMHALGELTRGWDPQYVEKIVNNVTNSTIAPLCYREALALIDHHRLLGHHVVIASASPLEIVRPIAHLLSIPDALSTIVGQGQDGLADGTITHFNHGEGKAEACAALARERGWDLNESFAYSDSISDLPMLELVGNPRAVNSANPGSKARPPCPRNDSPRFGRRNRHRLLGTPLNSQLVPAYLIYVQIVHPGRRYPASSNLRCHLCAPCPDPHGNVARGSSGASCDWCSFGLGRGHDRHGFFGHSSGYDFYQL